MSSERAKQIKALRASVKHWLEDILEPVKKGEYPKRSILFITGWHYSTEEPLCREYFSNGCSEECPLVVAGKQCGVPRNPWIGNDNPWMKFEVLRNTKTAQAIIDLLEDLLFQAENGFETYYYRGGK